MGLAANSNCLDSGGSGDKVGKRGVGGMSGGMIQVIGGGGDERRDKVVTRGVGGMRVGTIQEIGGVG